MNEGLSQNLRDILITFNSGHPSSYTGLFRQLEFDDGAKETVMNCAGFIAGIYYSGNIRLAENLSKSLFDNLYFRGHAEDAHCKISSDYDCMSFGFLQFYRVDPDKLDEEMKCNWIKLPENRKLYLGYPVNGWYAFSMNGGIIFHGKRYLHCLDQVDPDAKWWSTHT
jgi:hypothetical protein